MPASHFHVSSVLIFILFIRIIFLLLYELDVRLSLSYFVDAHRKIGSLPDARFQTPLENPGTHVKELYFFAITGMNLCNKNKTDKIETSETKMVISPNMKAVYSGVLNSPFLFLFFSCSFPNTRCTCIKIARGMQPPNSFGLHLESTQCQFPNAARDDRDG